ncbi:MAG: methyltransferase domain-containing protein [Burkholderiaceae bacterium]|nr:methyltransferase domain-containing protein [Burkholderiaceae bacterium]
MSADNAEQIAEWNGEQGRRWAARQQWLDTMTLPFGQAALDAAGARPGERVLDIGCGCGSTTLMLARQVGAGGEVLGVDVSQPMLEVARRQAAETGLPVSFVEADAADAALPGGRDLLHSRFGLMFFNDPAAALRHLRGRLRPGGRIAFVCWRTPRDNPWAMAPLMAARQALGITPAAADPLAPGPFAFADDARLGSLLAEAGFAAADLQRFDAAIPIGDSARAAAQTALQIGPVARLAREAGTDRAAGLVDAIERALLPLAAADGAVRLNGSTWVVTATNPG